MLARVQLMGWYSDMAYIYRLQQRLFEIQGIEHILLEDTCIALNVLVDQIQICRYVSICLFRQPVRGHENIQRLVFRVDSKYFFASLLSD